MKKYAIVLMSVGLLVLALVPAAAHAQSHQRTGIDVFGGVGGNFCLSSGDVKCREGGLDHAMSWNIFINPGYRFSPIFGAYLDLSYGRFLATFDGRSAGFVNTMAAMLVLRGYTVFREGAIFGGAGIGYSRLSLEYSSTVTPPPAYNFTSWSNIPNFKVNAGAEYNVNRNIAIGVNLDLVFNVDGMGTMCAGSGGAEICSTSDIGAIIDMLQLGVFVRGTFPYELF